MAFRPLLPVIPTAFVAAAALALASPASAFDIALDETVELAQASPPARGMGHGMTAHNLSPRSTCLDRVARRIGNRAYLKARLELKPDQMAAWDAFEKAANEASARENARCATLPEEMNDASNIVERLAMREEAMKARLASIQSVKPTLLAAYDVLTPAQKAVLDRPARGMMGRGPGQR